MGYIVGKQPVRDSLYVLLQHAQEAGDKKAQGISVKAVRTAGAGACPFAQP